MSQDAIDLAEVLRLLASGESLSPDLALQVLSEIIRTLRDENAEIEWDDAWNTLDWIGPHHSTGLPFLCEIAQGNSKVPNRNSSERAWAIRAIAKIGADSGDVVPVLTTLLEDKSREVRGEAATALRKCGHGHLVKRRWFG